MYTCEHPMISNPKECLELGLIYHLRLSKGKGIWDFWEKKASYGKVTRKSLVNKGCLSFLCRFKHWLLVKSAPLPLPHAGERETSTNGNLFYKSKTSARFLELFLHLILKGLYLKIIHMSKWHISRQYILESVIPKKYFYILLLFRFLFCYCSF